MTNRETPYEQVKPVARGLLSKGVYSLCYYLAFGATYAGELAMELVPADSMIRHGIRDGAAAAERAWARASEGDEIAEREMELPAEPQDLSEASGVS